MATVRTSRRLDDYPVSLQRAAYAIYGERIRQELDEASAGSAPAVAPDARKAA